MWWSGPTPGGLDTSSQELQWREKQPITSSLLCHVVVWPYSWGTVHKPSCRNCSGERNSQSLAARYVMWWSGPTPGDWTQALRNCSGERNSQSLAARYMSCGGLILLLGDWTQALRNCRGERNSQSLAARYTNHTFPYMCTH